jgi:hypothetical protein
VAQVVAASTDFRLAWPGLAYFGLALAHGLAYFQPWPGLAWPGLALAWPGLA